MTVFKCPYSVFFTKLSLIKTSIALKFISACTKNVLVVLRTIKRYKKVL